MSCEQLLDVGKLRNPLEGDVFRWFKAARWTRPQTGCVVLQKEISGPRGDIWSAAH